MKRIVLLSILFYALQAPAQISDPIELFVCYNKTVNIIFPYAIASEDHGNNGLIVQQRKGADHILHVKANQKDFAPTSLSVVTSDGNLYSFVIRYVDDVYRMNYVIDVVDAAANIEVRHNQRVLDEECKAISDAAPNIRRKVTDDFSILRLRGLYVSRNALWLKIVFTNCTRYPAGIV